MLCFVNLCTLEKLFSMIRLYFLLSRKPEPLQHCDITSQEDELTQYTLTPTKSENSSVANKKVHLQVFITINISIHLQWFIGLLCHLGHTLHFCNLGFPQLKLLKHELHVFITSYIKMGKGSTGLIKTNKVWYDLSLYYK